MTASAAKSKNHGRKPGKNSKIAQAAASAGAVLKRMDAEDANRGKPSGNAPKAPSKPAAPKPAAKSSPPAAPKQPPKPVEKPAAKAPAKPTAAPKTAAKPAAKPASPTPKSTSRPGKKAGVDSTGKNLREGDDVRVTGGHGQGKNGTVVSKGKAGQVRVRTEDGNELDVHSSNLRNRQDHEASRAADAALRKAAGRGVQAKPAAATGPSAEAVAKTQKDIRDAYAKLAHKPGDWISLSRLRPLLGADRATQDAALMTLMRGRHAILVPESNQKILTQADRDAAIHFGDQDKHLLSIPKQPN